MVSRIKKKRAFGLLTGRRRTCAVKVMGNAYIQRLTFDKERTVMNDECSGQCTCSCHKTQAQELAEDTIVDIVDAGSQVTCMSLMVDARVANGGDVAITFVNVKSRKSCHRHENRQ